MIEATELKSKQATEAKVRGPGVHPLVCLLTELQRVHGFSHGEMARKLGMTRSMWYALRMGEYPLRFEALAGIAREFPALKDEVWKYLRTAPRRGGGEGEDIEEAAG